MKTILTIILICLFVGVANGENYYYCQTAAGSEDASDCSNCDDIAGLNANAQSLTGNDFVYLCDTEKIRSQIIFPAAGSEGSPITISNAPGDSPIITAYDEITTWTESATWQTALTLAGGLEFDTTGVRNYRESIAADALAYGGTKVRLTYTAGDGSAVIDGTSIGLGTTGDDFDSAPTRVTWDTANGVTISTGVSEVSDEITFTIDTTKRYLFHIYTTNRDNFVYTAVGAENGYYGTTGDDTLTQTVTYNAMGTTFVGLTKVETSGYIWQAALTTAPKSVRVDGELYTLASSAAEIDVDEWYWDSNILYIYATADPDGAVTVEAAVRNHSMQNKLGNYTVFDGLIFRGCTTPASGNNTSVVYNSASNVEYKNCTFEWGAPCDGCGDGLGLVIGGDADTVLIHDSYLQNNANDGVWLNECSNVSIYDNIFTGNGTGDGDRNNIGMNDAADTLIYGNYLGTTDDNNIEMGSTDDSTTVDIYNNFMLQENFRAISMDRLTANIFNNIFIGNTSHEGIYAKDLNGPTIAKIYNNVFYGWDESFRLYYEVGGNEATTAVEFINNVSVSPNSYHVNIYDELKDNVTINYNLYYPDTGTLFRLSSSDYNFTDWKTNSNQDDSSPTPADPLLNADYTLQANSPCINTGTIPTGHETDYPLHPELTTFSPWSPVQSNRDYGLREIGAFVYFEAPGTGIYMNTGNAVIKKGPTTTIKVGP